MGVVQTIQLWNASLSLIESQISHIATSSASRHAIHSPSLFNAMPPSGKQTNVEDNSSDLACTRCRERKIRCGRERPTCGNCEKEPEAQCEYRQPTKRVNHLKLLCDSVELLQSRLSQIESHLRQPNAPRRRSSRERSANTGSSEEEEEEEGEEEVKEDFELDDEWVSDSIADVRSSLHISHNEAEQIDRWFGPSSLYVLCNRLRLKLSELPSLEQVALETQTLCDDAGSTESFPSFTTQPLTYLVPKQQALAAIEAFFSQLDYCTDLFDKSNLLYNVERIYSTQLKPQDEVWAVCFRTLVLLVVAKEISSKPSKSNQGLFGDLARTFLPSRAALVNSQLLTQPRLINVQVLILLSIATQQLDPLNWTELLFTHACILARTMGLQNTQICTGEDASTEAIERAKVMRALYCRDRNLFMSFGCTPWLPANDKSMLRKFSSAVERSVPYSDRVRLAIIQDKTYTIIHSPTETKTSTRSRISAVIYRMEEQLKHFSEAVGLFQHPPHHPECNKLLILEFLNTRIMALQQSQDDRHKQQVLRDARASCCLLLSSAGLGNATTCEQYAINVGLQGSESPSPLSETRTCSESDESLATLLDAFSAPAFFALLEPLLTVIEENVTTAENTVANMDLLRGVATCYARETARTQTNNYTRKVSRVFTQLVSLFDRRYDNTTSMAQPPANIAPVANMLEPRNVFSVTTLQQVPALQHASSDTSSMLSTPSISSTATWDGVFSPNAFLDSLPDQMSMDFFSGLDVLDNFESMDWDKLTATPYPKDTAATHQSKRQRTSDETNNY